LGQPCASDWAKMGRAGFAQTILSIKEISRLLKRVLTRFSRIYPHLKKDRVDFDF
jgi:phage terminase Nu1 subunit (DNA packaging protein)